MAEDEKEHEANPGSADKISKAGSGKQDKKEEPKTSGSAELDGKGKKGRIPSLWDGNAGKRIVDILIEVTK